ncbi:MAG TPA: ABC transporter permease [Bryobacteraceae bacterium]|nr:ABC transporter permease [Bryobacteraceae bacterium]
MRIQHWMYELPLRFRSLFHRQRVEQELDDELQYHLDCKIDEYVTRGLAPREARYAAMRDMDGLAQRKEECRDARHVNAIENTIRDIRYALRVLVKSPGFTVVAIVTLAMAIGANAIAFGIMNGLILRPLNVPNSENLWGISYGDGSSWHSYPNYADLRDRNRSFEDVAAFTFAFAGMDIGKDPIVANGFSTTGNYFDVLGIQPYLGRFFHSSDEHGPNSAPYLVLTWAYWHAHFQDDRNVIGRTVRIDKHPFTIIGVAPRSFQGTVMFVSPDFFMPIVNHQQVEAEFRLDARGNERAIFELFGHLKPGVTRAQALADMNSIGAGLKKTYPNQFANNSSNLWRPGLSAFGGAARAFAGGVMMLAALILIAACMNLGNLFGARAADRSREVALRLAIGATRARILRGLLTEAVLLALAGGAVGLLGSVVLLEKLSLWQPFGGAPVHIPVTPDARIYFVALALALVSGFLFGIVPVRQVLRTDPYQVIKAGSRGPALRRISVRDVLLAVQIALCAVLVTSSMVALRGLVRSQHSDFGFEPRNTILVSTNLAMVGYNAEQTVAMQKRMIEAVETIPGVEHAGLVNNYPPLVYASAVKVSIFKDETRDLIPANVAARTYPYDVSPRYFAAAGTRLLAGRDFTWHDDRNAPRVAVVNREFAVRMFGSVAGAVGEHYRLQSGARVEVVGVAENGKYLSLTEDSQPAMFLPAVQSPLSASFLIVRSTGDQQQLSENIRAKIHGLETALPVDTNSWNAYLEIVLFPARAATMALGVLGALGAILSITGIFGMASYSVSRRLKELGIRLALGARRNEVLRTALGRSFKVLAFGSVVGLILGILASRVLASIVYQATPRDPIVLTAVVVAMGLLGLVATWIPAQRALSLDPLTLLRED